LYSRPDQQSDHLSCPRLRLVCLGRHMARKTLLIMTTLNYPRIKQIIGYYSAVKRTDQLCCVVFVNVMRCDVCVCLLQLQEFLQQHDSQLPLPAATGEDTIFEYVVGDKGTWEHWQSRVITYRYFMPSHQLATCQLMLSTDHLVVHVDQSIRCVCFSVCPNSNF